MSKCWVNFRVKVQKPEKAQLGTLRIELRIKIFYPVHYPPGSNPHTKNCYPSEVNNGRQAATFNFIDLKFFKMHPLLKPHNLFSSDGVAILSCFHDIPQNLSVEFTDVINYVKVLGQLQGQGPKT